jgi:hypothetical protein
VTTRIEYAVAEGPDLEVQVLMGTDRERAVRLTASWNSKKPGVATLMTRTVTATEWEPANTGVVPPQITERTGDGTDGERPR